MVWRKNILFCTWYHLSTFFLNLIIQLNKYMILCYYQILIKFDHIYDYLLCINNLSSYFISCTYHLFIVFQGMEIFYNLFYCIFFIVIDVKSNICWKTVMLIKEFNLQSQKSLKIVTKIQSQNHWDDVFIDKIMSWHGNISSLKWLLYAGSFNLFTEIMLCTWNHIHVIYFTIYLQTPMRIYL